VSDSCEPRSSSLDVADNGRPVLASGVMAYISSAVLRVVSIIGTNSRHDSDLIFFYNFLFPGGQMYMGKDGMFFDDG